MRGTGFQPSHRFLEPCWAAVGALQERDAATVMHTRQESAVARHAQLFELAISRIDYCAVSASLHLKFNKLELPAPRSTEHTRLRIGSNCEALDRTVYLTPAR